VVHFFHAESADSVSFRMILITSDLRGTRGLSSNMYLMGKVVFFGGVRQTWWRIVGSVGGEGHAGAVK
jgi:hypothetical protein